MKHSLLALFCYVTFLINLEVVFQIKVLRFKTCSCVQPETDVGTTVNICRDKTALFRVASKYLASRMFLNEN